MCFAFDLFNSLEKSNWQGVSVSAGGERRRLLVKRVLLPELGESLKVFLFCAMGRLLCGHNIFLLTPSSSVEEKLRLLQTDAVVLRGSRSQMEGSFCLSMSLSLNVSLNVRVQILVVCLYTQLRSTEGASRTPVKGADRRWMCPGCCFSWAHRLRSDRKRGEHSQEE